MRANLSLMGLYNFDPALFDGFNYPTKWTEEDQETFRNKLLFDTAELEVLYPSPAVMNTAMKVWSRAMLPNWDKLYDTTQFDYNPIWNKDGMISETETIKRDNAFEDQRKGTGSTSNTTTNDISQISKSSQNTTTNTETNISGSTSEDTNETNSQQRNANSTQKDYVFGFNSNEAAQSEQHENVNSETTSGTNLQNTTGTSNNKNIGAGTENITADSEQTNTNNIKNNGSTENSEILNHSGNDNEGREYKRIEQGNIGITTTQQMIREEREVDKFNLMDYIIDSFINRFCLMVY